MNQRNIHSQLFLRHNQNQKNILQKVLDQRQTVQDVIKKEEEKGNGQTELKEYQSTIFLNSQNSKPSSKNQNMEKMNSTRQIGNESDIDQRNIDIKIQGNQDNIKQSDISQSFQFNQQSSRKYNQSTILTEKNVDMREKNKKNISIESQKFYKIKLNKNISRNIFDKQFDKSMKELQGSSQTFEQNKNPLNRTEHYYSDYNGFHAQTSDQNLNQQHFQSYIDNNTENAFDEKKQNRKNFSVKQDFNLQPSSLLDQIKREVQQYSKSQKSL